MATPHGRSPTLTVATKRRVATSTTHGLRSPAVCRWVSHLLPKPCFGRISLMPSGAADHEARVSGRISHHLARQPAALYREYHHARSAISRFTDTGKIHTEFTSIAIEAIPNDFATTFIKAVFAGWLIALMVWMLLAASGSKVAIIAVMTYMIGIGELSHIIVGSTEVLYLVVTGQASLATYFGDFVAPALLGNVAGGLLLVSALNHAQVVAGGQHRK